MVRLAATLLLAAACAFAQLNPKEEMLAGNRAIAQHRFEDAETHFALALQLARDTGTSDLTVADILENLGSVQRELSEIPAAKAAYQECIAIRSRRLGPDSAAVATAMQGLARTLLRDHDAEYADVVNLLRQVLAIREKTLGPDAPETGNTATLLAITLYSTQWKADADKTRGEIDRLCQRVQSVAAHAPDPGAWNAALALEFCGRYFTETGRDGTELSERAARLRAEAITQSREAVVPQGPVLRIGGEVTPPRVIQKVEPVYTDEARLMKLNGTVVLSTIIDEQGRAVDIDVVRGAGFGLDEQAIDCVRQWRFAPGTRDGRPVNVRAEIEVNFRVL